MIRHLQAATAVLAALAVLFVMIGPGDAIWTRAAAWLGLAALGLGMLILNPPKDRPDRDHDRV